MPSIFLLLDLSHVRKTDERLIVNRLSSDSCAMNNDFGW